METFVSQLRSVAKLPDQRTLFGMSDNDIADKNNSLDMLLTHYEAQLRRDYKAFMLAKERNSILAKLNYDQLLHLCTLEEQLHTTVQERDRMAQLDRRVDRIYGVERLIVHQYYVLVGKLSRFVSLSYERCINHLDTLAWTEAGCLELSSWLH